MSHLAIEHALLAVLAARGGDKVTACYHIAHAQQQTRTTGDIDRAGGLAFEHVVQFPDDAELLARISPSSTPESSMPRTH